jgi:hypothetical protein
MSAIGNIFDLQANGYGEKVVIYGTNGLPVDWGTIGSGTTTTAPERIPVKETFVFDPGAVDNNLIFQICAVPGQLVAVKITNTFYVDLFAQVLWATDEAAAAATNGYMDRFMVGSMQTVALDGENLFVATDGGGAGTKLFIRFSTDLVQYEPLTGPFTPGQSVAGNTLCLIPSN